jgi:L-amino acid N-acyltransferase YncA
MNTSGTMSIRPARSEDIPAINAIHAYYVLNTVITFLLEPLSDEATLAKFEGIKAEGLPFLVAVQDDTILGYTYVSPFRSAKGGYKHSVELSLFCHHETTSKGAGSALLAKVTDILKRPEAYDEDWISGRWATEDGKANNVISCMSLDETGMKGGWALKEWYEKRGFEMGGHLKKVGRKFDRWYVVLCADC